MAGARSRSTPSADPWRRQAAFASRESGPASDLAIRGSALDRLRDPGDAGELSGKSADEQAAPAGQLSSGIPAWLGKQDLLHPTAARSAGAAGRGGNSQFRSGE